MAGLRRVAIKVFSDLLCIFLVFLPWIVLQAVNKPFRRGFFCNDDSIKYPYLDNTVTNETLTATGFVLTFVVVLASECTLHFVRKKSRHASIELTNSVSLPYLVVYLYKFFGTFLFGMAVQQTLVNIGKYSIGRLRPHFMSVCKPDFGTLNCTAAGNLFLYVTDYTCEVEVGKIAIDSRLSFPSGHSSFAAYCAIYLVMYLQSRVTFKSIRVLIHLLQGLFVYGAFYVCLSRVSDFKHHPTDVLAGGILGSIVAFAVGLLMADFNIGRDSMNSGSTEEGVLENRSMARQRINL